jgi:ribA/ribD-fused uncharacterized protein
MSDEPEPNYVFFYGHGQNTDMGYLSQWYMCNFQEDSHSFSNAEQYMMWRKAILFNDHHIASLCLTTTNPRSVKALGRRVSGFDMLIWAQHRYEIVKRANYLKFSQNRLIRMLLINFDDTVLLVEASPRDRIWGIGYSACTALNNKPRWGLNLLGKALTDVRLLLIADTHTNQ